MSQPTPAPMELKEVPLPTGEDPLPAAAINARLERMLGSFEERASHLLGYQANQAIDYSALAAFLRYSPNNIGDPYIDSNYGVHSRVMEREVLDFVARLFHIDDRKYWGYVTTGGTEANIYGLYIGRNYLESLRVRAGASGHPQPRAYFSQDTHYSINKTMDLLRIPSQTLPSDPQGRIDVPRLIEAILRNDKDAQPPLIVANLGTTFSGAYDDVEQIVSALASEKIENYYLHVDAALGGFFLPFVERLGLPGTRVPIFDFRLPIHSVAFSGHKIAGAPFPCGVFMTHYGNLAYGNSRQVEYIGSVDTTLAGSRSGLAPIVMWYAIATSGISGFVELARHMLAMADYAMEVIGEAGYRPWKNPLGLSVIFDRPPDWVVRKWSLSTQGDSCHVYAMRHMSRERLDGLAADLRAVRSVFAASVAEDTSKALDRPLFLKSVSLFASMDPEDLWKVARVTAERWAEPGEYLCRHGDSGDDMFIVVSGEVEIVDDRVMPEELRHVARTGEAIGEIAVLTSFRRTASMRCRVRTHLLVLRGTDFRTILHQHPQIASQVIQILVQRLAPV